jgi:hypothetical protein
LFIRQKRVFTGRPLTKVRDHARFLGFRIASRLPPFSLVNQFINGRAVNRFAAQFVGIGKEDFAPLALRLNPRAA